MSFTNYTPALSADWDLQIGEDGQLLMLRGTEAICQNVANEGRCFKSGLYFFQDHGIDWFSDQLGKKVQRSVIASSLREAALAVDGVSGVRSITINSLDNETRTLTGTIEITTDEGENGRAEIR